MAMELIFSFNNNSAVEKPIPLEPPVMRIFLPLNYRDGEDQSTRRNELLIRCLICGNNLKPMS